jgi:hypothetical protein
LDLLTHLIPSRHRLRFLLPPEGTYQDEAGAERPIKDLRDWARVGELDVMGGVAGAAVVSPGWLAAARATIAEKRQQEQLMRELAQVIKGFRQPQRV